MPLAAILLVVVPAMAADPLPIKIRWHGQSMFEIITPEGTKIVIDPHVIEAYGKKKLTADLILMTHPHDDHTRIEAVENNKQAKKIEAVLTQRDGPRVQQEWKIIDEKFKDVRIQTMGTYHDEVGGMDRGKNGVFILDIAGVRIVHLGDLGHQLSDVQLKKLGKVDVLMIPIGGVYTLNGVGAFKVVQQIKPSRFVIPMHYGTEVYTDLLDGKYFIDEYNDADKGKLIKKTPLTNELSIDPKGPLPEEAIVMFLGYRSKQ
jgi:L-ascorbate metabolism protein UlaG (beta-lactamase superfamily)